MTDSEKVSCPNKAVFIVSEQTVDHCEKLHDALGTAGNRDRWRAIHSFAKWTEIDLCGKLGICTDDEEGDLFAMFHKQDGKKQWTTIDLVCGSRTTESLKPIPKIEKRRWFAQCSRPGGINIGQNLGGFDQEVDKYMSKSKAQAWETEDGKAFMITSEGPSA